MKLRNKKTGEIGTADTIIPGFNSIRQLNEEWEDYEEPKYWSIERLGNVSDYDDSEDIMGFVEDCKSIGNYFETKEEAEKAVEKLKAWKRLEDRGLRIKLRHFGHNATLEANYDVLEGDYLDLVTVFGGEE